MRADLEPRSERTPAMRRAAAGLILVLAVALGIWLLIGVIKTVVWTAAIIAVVLAVLWALKTLVW